MLAGFIRNVSLQYSVFALFLTLVSALIASKDVQAAQASSHSQQIGATLAQPVQKESATTSEHGLSKFSVLPFVGVGFVSKTDEYTHSGLEISSWSADLGRYFGYGIGVGYKITDDVEIQGGYTALPNAVVSYDNYAVSSGCKNQNGFLGLSCEVGLAYSGFGLEIWYKRLGLGVLSWERKLEDNGFDDNLTKTLFPNETNSGIAFTVSGQLGAFDDEGVSIMLKYIALKDELVDSNGTQFGAIDGLFLATVGYRFVL